MKFAYFEVKGIQTGAKEGERVLVPRLDLNEGVSFEINKILYIRNNGDVLIGQPYVEGARIKAKVIGEKILPKIVVFKYKHRKKYRRKKGHRQRMTEILIEKIISREV